MERVKWHGCAAVKGAADGWGREEEEGIGEHRCGHYVVRGRREPNKNFIFMYVDVLCISS